MNLAIEKNRFGFHQVVSPPSAEELDRYYAERYFQQETVYKGSYDAEERAFLHDKLIQKEALIRPFIGKTRDLSILDVGCGEGFTLPFFESRGWRVLGTDFGSFAIRNHHPDFLDRFIEGPFDRVHERLVHEGRTFTVVWLDNVLEHVRDPLAMLRACASLTQNGGLLMVDVPNDFSPAQLAALELGMISEEFWVALPDHLSYFNAAGLRNLALEAGWIHCRTVADFPIDFNLFHDSANYVADRSRGAAAHGQRRSIERLLVSISVEKTLDYYEALANLGLGRSINAVFTKAS